MKVTLSCTGCGRTFERDAVAARRRPTARPFCSPHCRRAATTGERNPNFGKHWSPERKAAMSAKKMGTPAWNKGLTAAESGSVASYTQKQVGNTRGRANKGKPQPLTTLRNRTNNPMKRPEVRAKVSLLVRGRYGERNPNWGGGGKSYRGWDWPQQSAAARQRDNATCRACGKRRGRLNVHHVIPYEQTQDNGLDNLVTLCVGCHAKVEAGTIPCPTTPPRPPTQPTAAAPLPAT